MWFGVCVSFRPKADGEIAKVPKSGVTAHLVPLVYFEVYLYSCTDPCERVCMRARLPPEEMKWACFTCHRRIVHDLRTILS